MKKLFIDIISKITWKRVIIAFFLASLIGLFAVSMKVNEVSSIEEIFTNTEALENTYYISQVLVAIAIILGTIIAIWQYRRFKINELDRYSNECISRAVELARYYKDNILNRSSFLFSVYEETGISAIIKTVKSSDMIYFDEKELYENFNKEQIKEIKNIRSSKKFVQVISVLLMAKNEGIEYKQEIERFLINEEKEEGVAFIRNKIVSHFGTNYVAEVLNNLEYFAMHFTHETADHEVVYQSLHSSYLMLVETLYFDISMNNKTTKSKLYTNVIELYKKWKSISNNQREKENKHNFIIKGKKSNITP